jgi:putative salt-induced outer membrane protein YdiY
MKMINRTVKALSATIGLLFFFSSLALAQAPAPAPAAPPAREYSGSFGGGITLTGGNTDTRSYNLAFNHIHERKNGNTDKITALYLRGEQNDVLTLDRASVIFRDEYKLSKRVFLFGEVSYLHDPFRDVNYYVAPVGGLGYKFVDTDRTKLQFSGGAGGTWERNSYVPVKSSGAVNAGQNFSQKISTSSEFVETVVAVWNTNDFSDSLTGFSAGLTTSISKQFELKVEFRDSYKNLPPNPTIKKNDTALVITFLLKY